MIRGEPMEQEDKSKTSMSLKRKIIIRIKDLYDIIQDVEVLHTK